MTSIFLSHSSTDNTTAEVLKERLLLHGHTVFLDFDPESGIKGGADWEKTLYERLRVCRVVIPLLTPAWLTSKWCFAEVVHARSNGKAIVPLKVEECDASSVFPDIQQINLIQDPEEGYHRLEAALQEAFPWDPQRPPYPGLLAYQEDDAAIFFGRTLEIAEAIETLESLRRRGPAAPRFALVLGASGSGKSSLVRAGILPRLRVREGWLPIPPLRPREDPLGELAAALAQAYEQVQRPREYAVIRGQLEEALVGEKPDGMALIDIARDLSIKAQHSGDTVLLVIDQAEELFGESGTQQTNLFLRLLRASLERADGHLMVFATMRSEFLGVFQTHPFLLDSAYPEPFAYQEITLDPMPVDRFSEIIRGPAELAGIGIEEALVEHMVTDTGTRDALPLLAYTLRRLWDSEVYRADGRFDLSEYAALGGLEGSIRKAAEEALGASEQTDQLDVLRAALVPALVRVGADGARVRRRAYRDELLHGAEKPIQRFVDARLLVTDRDRDGRETIELAHEALLREWPQLDVWLEQDQDKLRLLESVLGAAEEWQRSDRTPDLLVHRGDRLADALALVREPRFALKPGTPEAEYLAGCEMAQWAQEEAEREERERQIRDAQRIADEQRRVAHRTLAGLLVALFLAIGAGIAGWVAWNKATEAELQRVVAERAQVRAVEERTLAEKQARVALARQLATQAQAVVNGHPQRALLLAMEALRRPLELDGVRLPGPENALRELLSKVGGAPVIGPLEHEHLRYLKDDHKNAMSQHLLLDPGGRWLAVRAKDKTYYDVFSLADTTVPRLRIGVPSNIKLYPAFDPQGRWFAINGADGVVRLWELPVAKKGQPESFVELTGNKAGISDLAFDREGRYFAAATYDGYVLVWDTTDLKNGPQKLRAWEQDVARLAFDSHGVWLAAISKGTVGVWNLTDLAAAPIVLPGRLRGSAFQRYDLAIGPKGRWLAAGDADRAAYLWDLTKPSAEPATVKLDVTQYVNRVAFDPLGRWLAMLPTDNNVRLVKLADPVAPLVVPKSAGRRSYSTRMLAFDPKGRWLATGDDAKTASSERAEGHIRLWDLSNPTFPPRVLRGHEQRVLAVVFSGDGRWLTSVGADKVVRRWDLTRNGAAPSVLHGHEGWIVSVALDPMGRWLASGHRQGVAQLSDLTDPGTGARQIHGQSGNVGVSFDPKGRWLATSDKNRILRLWDIRDSAASQLSRIKLLGHDQETVTISRFGFDPKGRWLVAGSEKKNTVLLWNLENPKSTPLVLRGHEERIETLAFDPAGQWLATGSGDGSARLWSLENPWAEPRVLQGLGGGVRRIGIDPEGTWVRVIFSSGAKKILEWDLKDTAVPPRTPQPYERLAQAEEIIAFDSHWRWLVTKDPELEYRLRESANPDGPAVLLKGPGRFIPFRFDPLGRWLATGGIDGSARLWPLTDPNTGQVVLRGHQKQVWSLAFGASGRWLATASTDGTVRLWDLHIENLLDLACQIAGRNLSKEEWAQYLGGFEYRLTCPDVFSGAEGESNHEIAE